MTNNSDTLSISSSEDFIDAFTTLFDLEVAIEKIKNESEERRSRNNMHGADAILAILPMLEAVRKEASPEAITALAEYRQTRDENNQLKTEISNLKINSNTSSNLAESSSSGDYRDAPYLELNTPNYCPKLSAAIHCWIYLFHQKNHTDMTGVKGQVVEWLIKNRPELAFHKKGHGKGRLNKQAIDQIAGILTYRSKRPD